MTYTLIGDSAYSQLAADLAHLSGALASVAKWLDHSAGVTIVFDHFCEKIQSYLLTEMPFTEVKSSFASLKERMIDDADSIDEEFVKGICYDLERALRVLDANEE